METASDDPRAVFLRLVWEAIRGWNEGNINNIPAASRAVTAGAAAKDVALAMNAAAYEAVFQVLSLIDERGDAEAELDAPGWALVAAVESDDGSVTPTDLYALSFMHESLLTADPTGVEGADLFE
ncbi:MAG TPA: hypothetical protein VGW38_27975 [Chloroflexota bacterium]|nr:hypothetical protein [Chloroflexota bacterium]